jgi:hypothetical protein
MIELIGGFFIGAGIVMVGYGCVIMFMNWRTKRNFARFLERIRDMAAEEVTRQVSGGERGKEVSELSFRDKDGVMNTVRIVIDPNLDATLTDEDKEEVKSVLSGNVSPNMQVGTMDDLLKGHKIEESAMEKVQEFVFSSKAVRDMRSHGIEPDEVVTKMLRASGRMAE